MLIAYWPLVTSKLIVVGWSCLERPWEQHAPKFLLMAKLSFGLAIPTLVAAGLTRLSWRKWFPIVFIGETIFTGTLVIVGYFATEALKKVDHGVQLFLVAMSFVFLLMAVWYIPKALRDSKPLQMSRYEDKE
jgi:membrane protein DedA with SNARE-associated domain